MTDELLREVALVHAAPPLGRSPVEAVRDALHVAPSTAWRYIKLAKERGFIEGTSE
jgi:hypothetical protein